MLNVDTTTVISHTKITAEIPRESNQDIESVEKAVNNTSKTNITSNEPLKTSPVRNVSKTNLNGLIETEPLYQTVDITKKKPKAISVVELNVEKENIKNLEQPTKTNNTKTTENDVNQEEVSKEITNIINKAVEINETKILPENDGNNNNLVQSKDWQPNQIETNNNYGDDESKPESPLWIYTLPAPPTFADNKIIKSNEVKENEEIPRNFVTSSPIENNKINGDQNLVENPIRPIIIEKHHLDFQDLSDNSLPHSLSTTDTLTTIETNATDPDSLITSDIEDGYQGNENDRVAMKNIQNRQEQFIEDEFKFLKDHSEDKAVDNNNAYSNKPFKNGGRNGLENGNIGNGKQILLSETQTKQQDIMNYNVEHKPRKLSNGEQKNTIKSRKLSNEDDVKTVVIEELNNILNSNRLDTVIRKPDEDEKIDTLKRSSLTNFQIGSYMNGNHEKVAVDCLNNGQRTEINGLKASAEVDQVKSLEKRGSLPMNGLNTETEHDSTSKTFKNIIRSKSFHSMQHSEEQSLNEQNKLTNGNPRLFALTPRTSSYISLIGTQKFDNKHVKIQSIQADNTKIVSRQRSISELSIADSPSLQSLEIMKSILNNSRKNSLVEQNGHKFISNGNANENSNKNGYQDEVDLKSTTTVQTQPKSFDSKVPETDVVMRCSNKSKEPQTCNESKKWTYQGPPSINLSTWGERPKSQVIIKSDNDYKFGGMSKVSAMQKRFSAALEENSVNANNNNGCDRNDVHANDSKSYKLPIVRSVEYKKNVIMEQTNGNSKSNEDSVELRQRPSYEVSHFVSEKPSSTMTLGRVPASKPAVTNQHSQRFINNHNSRQQNSAFNQFTNHNNKFTPVVKGFRTQDFMNGNHNGSQNEVEHDYVSNGLKHQPISTIPPAPVKPTNSTTSVVFTTYDQEKKHIEVERPSFSQYALKKTGLKEKTVDETYVNEHGINKGYTTVDGKPKMVNGNRHSVPAPPPKPMHRNGFLPQNQQVKSTNGGNPRSNSLTLQKNGDSRDQLLDSIRNFNKNALKRS